MAEQEPQNQPNEPTSTGHNYDGIQEYDNPTPLWWDLIFVGSILFAPFYIMWFHAPQAERTLVDQYDVALAKNMKLQFGEIGTLEPTEENVLRFINDSKWLTVGKSTFAANCASCHGREGEGISGVNLTDDHYKNVNELGDVVKVIQNGANAGAMPAWQTRLHPNEVVLVASYVASLRGQNKPGRQAEGKIIAPWPEAPALSADEEPAEESSVESDETEEVADDKDADDAVTPVTNAATE